MNLHREDMTAVMDTFVKGASYLFKGLNWLYRPEVRSFVIIPLLINTLLFGTLIWWGAKEFNSFLNWLLGYLPVWLDWLRWLVWPLFVLSVLLVSFYAFTLVANLIASPFNGLLAGRVENLVNPHAARSEAGPLWQEIALAPLTEVRKLVYLILWSIPLLLLFIIPVVNAVAPFIWALFSAWMLALQYLDYPMGNHGIGVREQRRQLRKQRTLALGFGAAVMLVTLVPILNFLVMPAAVIGATLLWVEQFSQARPKGTISTARSDATATPPSPDSPTSSYRQ